jgi:hypothetical protein
MPTKSGNRGVPPVLRLDLDESERSEQIEIGRHRDRQADEPHQAKRPERVLPEEVDDGIWDKIKHAATMRMPLQKSFKHFIQILANAA